MKKLNSKTLNRATIGAILILLGMSLQPVWGFTPPTDDPYPSEGLRGAGTRFTAHNLK